MATVLRKTLKDGTVSYKIQSKAKDPMTGKYKYFSETWKKPPTMSEYQARRELDRLKYELDEKARTEVQGITAKKSAIKFEDFADKWLERQKLQHSIRYYEYHKKYLKQIKPFFKQIKLVDITPTLTEEFRNELLKHTVFRENATLKKGKSLTLLAKAKKIVVKRIHNYGDVSYGTYSAANRGSPVRYENALKICNLLGINFDEYFDRHEFKRGYSKVTIKHTMGTLNLILKDAKRQRIIEHNFASSEYLLPLKGERKEINVLDDEEAKILKKQLDIEPDMRKKTAIYIVLMTGMRRSELCGLEWKDIDFKNETISIVRSCYDLNGYGLITKDTKTFTSCRKIAMPQILIKVLKEYKEWYNKRKEILGEDWAKSDRLMLSDDGKQVYPRTYRVWLGRLLKQAGLKDVTLHSLRHTNITMQLTSGIDLRTVSARAGHSRTSTTTDIYSHFIKNSDRHASKMIDKLFSDDVATE